jgi:exopolysaccharide biosynthesis polyprenyl glycosylphosphotransferase
MILMTRGRPTRNGSGNAIAETVRVHNARLKHFSDYAQPKQSANHRESQCPSFKKDAAMRGMILLRCVLAVALFLAVWRTFYREKPFYDQPNAVALVCLMYFGLVLWFGRIYHAFDVGFCRGSEIIASQYLTDFFSAGAAYALGSIACSRLLNPIPMIALVIVQGLWSIAWSLMASRVHRRIFRPRKTVVIYQQEGDLHRLGRIDHSACGFDVQKYIKEPRDIHQILREIDGFQAVLIAGLGGTLRDDIVNHCIENGIQSYVEPQVGDVILAGARHMQTFGSPFLKACRATLSPEYALIKRAFDIFGSLAGIILASPLMLLTALAIKLYDGGPALYKQVRLTRDRRAFVIWKFRSMCVDAERNGAARLATEHDDRITPVGRIIRAIRFDELPQLFNILNGSMTIVGPRPERPEIAERYEKAMPAFSLRLQVKAGLTGYAQVYGRYNSEPFEKLQMDLMYINNMSLAEDLKLIFATVKVLFLKESAQGVDEGQTTALNEKAERGKESA